MKFDDSLMKRLMEKKLLQDDLSHQVRTSSLQSTMRISTHRHPDYILGIMDAAESITCTGTIVVVKQTSGALIRYVSRSGE